MTTTILKAIKARSSAGGDRLYGCGFRDPDTDSDKLEAAGGKQQHC
jgi:hypothetical protein